MKTAVIYARYSSDRQTEQSIEGQLHVCNDYAERNNLVIVGTYIDRAMTGTNDNRDDFQRMLKDSDKKAWDYVLVYKLDRFSRNKYEMAIHRKRLKDNGIKILSAMENIPETPEGILLESLLEGMNQYYSEELSQKSKRGMRETRLKGKKTGGRINFGYTSSNQIVSVNEEEAQVLLQIFTDYANGKRIIDIVADLNSRGITNRGKPFLHNSIYYLLNTEKYTGVYRFGNEVFTNIYPQIIPTDLYQIVKKKMDANKHGKHVFGVDYMLRGKIVCGYCGKNLRSHTGKSGDGELYRYYECPSPRKTTNCRYKAIRKENLERLVTDAILNILSSKENFSRLTQEITAQYQTKMNQSSILRVLEKQLAQTDKSLTNLLKAIEAGIFTDTTKNRLQELESEKRELQEKIIIEKSKEKCLLTQKDFEKYLLYGLKQKPKAMLDLLVDKVSVRTDRIDIKLKYSADSPNDFPTKHTENEENPDGNNSDQGSLFLHYTAQYTVPKKGRIPKWRCEPTTTKYIEIFIYI